LIVKNYQLMELQQLRYVVSLAQERHFHRAAEKAFVTQPTLSQQIKKLEEELGTVLFERNRRGVRLTEAGQAFLPQAQAILEQVVAAKASVEGGPIRGKISLGAIPTLCPYWVPKLLRAVQQQWPQLTIELFEETTSILLQDLRRGVLDFALLALPITDAQLSSTALGKEAFWLAVADQHPLAKLAQVKPEQIKAEKLLILQEGHCFGDQTLAFCQKTRSDAQVIFQGSSLTSVLELAAAGEGITFVPQMAVRDYPGLRYLPFAAPAPQRELGAVWRKSNPLTRAHHELLRLMQAIGI
jgi:LysR family hydrogen peroxide-inducible transcriptional activator